MRQDTQGRQIGLQIWRQVPRERCRHLLESQSQQSENRPRPLRAEVTELVVVDAVLASEPGSVA